MSRQFRVANSDVITLANTPSTPTAYTYAFWLFGNATPVTTTTTQPVVFGVTSGNFGFSWDHASSSFKQAFFHQLSGGTFVSAQVSGTLSASVWYHFAGTWDGSNLTCYKNGVSQASPAAASVATMAGVSTLGADHNSNFWIGFMGEFAYWTRALAANELLGLANGHLAKEFPQSLKIYLPLWGLQSPEPDLSGNANNGTLSAALPQGGNPPVTLFTRKCRTAAEPDAVVTASTTQMLALAGCGF